MHYFRRLLEKKDAQPGRLMSALSAALFDFLRATGDSRACHEIESAEIVPDMCMLNNDGSPSNMRLREWGTNCAYRNRTGECTVFRQPIMH